MQYGNRDWKFWGEREMDLGCNNETNFHTLAKIYPKTLAQQSTNKSGVK